MYGARREILLIRDVPVISNKDGVPRDSLHAVLRVWWWGGVQGQAAGQDLVIVLHPITLILLTSDAHARQYGA